MGLFATLVEGTSIAFAALRANKVRSGLTILGVTIGVLVVMVMAAVIQGVNESFTELISSRGPTTFYVGHANFEPAVSTGLEEEEPSFFRNRPIPAAYAAEIDRLPEIQSASPVADLSWQAFQASRNGRDVRITVIGVGPEFMEIDNGDIVDGRFLTASENLRSTPVAVIDTAVVLDLFGGLDPLGRRIRIGLVDAKQATFEVIGVYSPPANLFAGFATHYVLVPYWAADKHLDVWDRLVSLVIRPNPGVSLEEAVDVVHARTRQLRGLAPGEEDDFVVVTPDEIASLWNNLTSVLFSAMVGLSSIALLVGGVGVIGIMMIAVTERTREIGLRKAVGARRRDVMWQFLVESSTMTALGGGLGLALGGGIVYALNTWTPVPAEVPLWSILAALAAAALTGIGFGLYPAARASRLDPVDALRYE